MWVKIDDGMATHPKILKAGPLALAIQIRAICYSSQNMTDGVIPIEAVPLLMTGLDRYGIDLGGNEHFSTGCQADELEWPEMMVEWGLWEGHPSGYIIHDYLEWNVSKSDREKWKMKLSRSGKKGMKSRWNKEKSDITKVITKVITKDITSIDNQPITMRSTSTSTLSSLSSESLVNKLKPRRQALEEFAVTDEIRNWARKEFSVEIPDDTIEEFKDHWRKEPEKKLRTDWKATFQANIRKLVGWGVLKPKFPHIVQASGKCQERVQRGNFLKPCGDPVVGTIGGRPLCQQHKEHHESRINSATT